MEEKKIGIVLGIVNIILLVVLGIFYVGKDREAPLIAIEDISLVYEEGIREEQLLKGVSAVDEKDGDISGSIVIEKIVIDSQQGLAVITYGARDEAGNMAKASRSVKMLVKETDMETEAEKEDMEEGFAEEVSEGTEAGREEASGEDLEEGNGTEAPGERSEDVSEGNNSFDRETGQNRNAEDEEGDLADRNAEAQEENAGNSEEDSREQEERQGALPTAGEASNDAPAETPKKGTPPEFTFSAGEVYTTKGYNPAWVTVIGKMQDDKDSYEYLFGTLKITGKYDRNTVGSYDVTVSVTDSDGNEASKPIRIIVEE